MVLFCPFFFYQVSAYSFHPSYEIFWESRSFCLTVLRQSFVAPVGLELACKVAWPWTCPSLLSAVIKGMHCHSFPVLFEKIFFIQFCMCMYRSVCKQVRAFKGRCSRRPEVLNPPGYRWMEDAQCGCWDLNSGLWKSSALLTAEPLSKVFLFCVQFGHCFVTY